jgi:hypothetical protein
MSVSIDWLLFSDGSFYGPQNVAEKLAREAKMRKPADDYPTIRRISDGAGAPGPGQ